VNGDDIHVINATGTSSGDVLKRSQVEFLTPITPSKIIGVGRNYRAHAQEMGGEVPKQPLFFLKPPSSLLAAGKTVLLPTLSEHVEYEAELGVVIGSRAHKLKLKHALDCVMGYAIVCDVTARDLQKSDGQWARAKGFDTFCPISSCVTRDVDARSLAIELRVNNQLKQSGNTRDMVFGIAEILVHLTQVMTLEPGDLIATGTPEGVGPLHAGDQVRITIEQLGELEFDVAAES
jgi:2-keto-4-pentenoate hydratase/2-oxohepta-3-ene-1,7-dioic acid hydratase in catechol pathway